MKILANPQLYTEKEALYINVRSTEGRVITDDILRMLPDVSANSPYKQEWILRAENYKKLIKHIHTSFAGKPITILDVGCGNGWMSNKLSAEGHHVTGMDLNMTELTQAEQVFGTSATLTWVYADIMKDEPGKKYDLILFSASVQYFPNLQMLTQRIQQFLNAEGEIHFHDSVFYDDNSATEAKQRSIAYYTNLGFPDMAGYYFHHPIKSLQQAGFKQVNAPRLFGKKPLLQWWMKKFA